MVLRHSQRLIKRGINQIATVNAVTPYTQAVE